MKLITANKLNRFWKNGILPKIREKIDKTKVLTTSEQVSANTNKENVASAIVTKELINDLGGCSLISEGSGDATKYYIQVGADAASKKLLGNPSIKNIVFNSAGSTNNGNFALRTNIGITGLKLYQNLFPVITGLNYLPDRKIEYYGSAISYSYDSATGDFTCVIAPVYQTPSGNFLTNINITLYYFT